MAAGGRKLHKHTGFRYVEPGVGGVKLRAIKVPGCGLMTHAKWVHEFIEGVNRERLARQASAPTPRRRRAKARKDVQQRERKTNGTLQRMGLVNE